MDYASMYGLDTKDHSNVGDSCDRLFMFLFKGIPGFELFFVLTFHPHFTSFRWLAPSGNPKR
ncbi:hypothetical protein OsccyDRAFT_4511 [Leptolyngbyaceae cyanobacterium JSC-12]|nr:hypothetical protein OsccyDRAFT_4511 [Leptolyngbyaceae cyanobacterium JSC-12]